MQPIIKVANDGYKPKPGISFSSPLPAVLCFVVFFNTVLSRRLPGIKGIIFILCFLGFVVFLVVLFIMGDRSTAKEVFADFQDNPG
jgi:choline transport protein